MIDSHIAEDDIYAMPVKDAMTFMVTLAWMLKRADTPGLTLSDAWALPLGDVLAAVNVAQQD